MRRLEGQTALVTGANSGIGAEIARGLVNYDHEHARQIIGRSSDRIPELLGFVSEEELIHRDNLVVVQ